MGSWFDGVYAELVEALTMKTGLKLAAIRRSSPGAETKGECRVEESAE